MLERGNKGEKAIKPAGCEAQVESRASSSLGSVCASRGGPRAGDDGESCDFGDLQEPNQR